MTVEAINAYFTPLDYALYLGAVFVIMVVWYQWKWSKICRTSILVLVQKADGHGDYQLAPQTGGSVRLVDPKTKLMQFWPINELSTIAIPYPGVGFVPAFLQKTIRMVIVSEEDWEPITNRSPDRTLVASPAFLGNLMGEQITAAVLTVNKEVLDSVAGLVRRLNKLVSPTMFYIGIGLVIAMMGFVAYQIIPMATQIEIIQEAIGIIQP
ncbi:hypothetical protein LCGC14_0539960 [marine sediment metagenome]|uniref:Uncharacterized protein n=1 Tax=marine sediment metagenome TaxID=412755 RepID=A0A0F9RXU5_9ZZZZ